jgi:predicted anti-sigma-YlaC factor YlaD
MFCDETLDAVEAIAAGEVTPEGRIAQHLRSCRQCAAALESARRLETMLQTRPVPRPPLQFTSRTMARIRRARWRNDQFLDVGFNLAVALVTLGVIATVGLLIDRSGVTAVSRDLLTLIEGGAVTLAQRIASSISLYLAAAALVLTALTIWWWVERDIGV